MRADMYTVEENVWCRMMYAVASMPAHQQMYLSGLQKRTARHSPLFNIRIHPASTISRRKVMSMLNSDRRWALGIMQAIRSTGKVAHLRGTMKITTARTASTTRASGCTSVEFW